MNEHSIHNIECFFFIRKRRGNLREEVSKLDQTFEKRKKVLYDFICDEMYVPMKIKEIAIVLQIPKEQRSLLKSALDGLVEEGKIYVTKRGKYAKGETKHFTGMFQANARGFGFVIQEGVEEDIFIAEENINGAFQGDQVEFIITKEPEGKRKEGKIVKILSHGMEKLVGVYEKCKSFGFVRPDNQRILNDIYIPSGKDKGAMTGHKVVVELTSYGTDRAKPEGKVVEILGHVNDPGTDILSIVKGYDLPTEFSQRILNQAERVGKEVTKADQQGRIDLRNLKMITIDGEDAKDLDDAVSLTMEGAYYHLGVHIADVTNYVQERSAIDKEALERGTSVYLADRVIPMLPHKLCNGICSLNEGEVRLALSCMMKINAKGEVVDHQIAETVVQVTKRMSYHQVQTILEEQSMKEDQRQVSKACADFVPMIVKMAELSKILRKKRQDRGAIDFDFPETKIILDENGTPLELKPYERNDATKLIEDFMLLANETVAEEYYWRELPFLYRTHEQPDEEKIKQLSTFINNFGYHIHIGNSEIRPKEVQKLLEKVEGTKEEPMIARLTLRAMKQAKYSPENGGHFGLASKYYTHFTSPIRRYPDLQIHRIIKENLRGRFNEERIEHYNQILTEVAISSSERERRAEEAERETIKLKKAEFMIQKIGKEFEGVISGITKWGIYVELSNTVEGLVHVMNMHDDHYDYIESSYEMVGVHTGKTYRLGQRVTVKVIGVDKQQRTIDFELV